MSEKNRVVITGIGLINPLGNNTQTCWQNLIAGKSGISFYDHPDLNDYPYKVFGLVKNEKEILDQVFPVNLQRKTDRFIHLAMIAGYQAMQDSGFSREQANFEPEKFGTCIGVGIGGLQAIQDSTIDFAKGGPRKVSPFLIPKAIINQASAYLSIKFNLQGPTTSVVNACSSSGDSVGLAFRMIRDGYADYMLTGGTESCITPLAISAFGNMRALCRYDGDDPKKACRPFDKGRSGFVMSEGAGILVLEKMDIAKKRNAKIYAEIIGYGSTSDAHHITAMHPEGRGAKRAIEIALQDAGVNKDLINYINAHGTSTLMNDKVETNVIKDIFGKRANIENKDHLFVSSTKSMTGHMLGAAGGTEVSFVALSLKNQIMPPTINLDNPDTGFNLDYVANDAKCEKLDFAISNSFGFGGGNSVVVLKRFN